MLIAAFATGQGTLFLAQSWLIANGQVGFIGAFGLAFSFAVLAHYIVDWGGLVLLARSELEHEGGVEADRTYWDLVIARGLVAIVVAGGLIAGASLVGDDFGRPYSWAVAPGLFATALNAGGVLDGLRRSGWAGLTSMLPSLASALALPVAISLAEDVRGVALGYAYTSGVVAGVLIQHGLVFLIGRRLRPSTAGIKGIRRAFVDGGLLLMTQLPGQLFHRIQLSVAAWLLGPAATGLVVYAKQVASAAQQGVYFVRRAEFPRLMRSLQETGSLRSAFRVQRGGIMVGLLIGMLLSLGGVAAWRLRSDELGEAAALAAAFGPVVLSAAIYGAFTQIFVGLKWFGTSAAVGNVIIAIGCLLTVTLVYLTGAVGIALAEFAMQLIGIAGLLYLWKRRRPMLEMRQQRSS